MDSNYGSVQEVVPVQTKKGITGSTLKLIAIFTMLIDHTAATIIERTLMARGMGNLNASDTQAAMNFFLNNAFLYYLDIIMRLIGRIAFPIFCFLLVEGFLHTHNKFKYAIRLAVFALISDIPFDLAFKNKPFDFSYQNVFFTLFIALLVLVGFEAVRERFGDKKWLPISAVAGAIAAGCVFSYALRRVLQYVNAILKSMGSSNLLDFNNVTYVIVAVAGALIAFFIYLMMSRNGALQKASIRYTDLLVLVAGMALAQFMKTDYSAFGVLTVSIMYGLRKNKVKEALGGCITLVVMSMSEITCFFAMIPIARYNGQRGLKLKYLFYAFYPVHLFILYLICYFMGI